MPVAAIGVGDIGAMPVGGDAVEDDASDADTGVVRGKAARHRGCRLCLAGRVEDEDDRQAVAGGKIGGSAPASGRAGQAVEEAHRRFDQHEVRVGRQIGEDGVEERRAHRPGIEIEAVSA